MNDTDKKLINAIKDEMLRRQQLLVESEEGTARWSSDPSAVDRINPTLIIGKEMVRNETGRTTVRDVLLDQYADIFKNSAAFSVSRGKDGEVIVKTLPSEDDDNTFTSLNALRKANAKVQEEDDVPPC